MESNKTYRFKTNINCNGCVNTIKPYLNNVANLIKWEVDTNSLDKILTVETKNLPKKTIMDIVQKAGFKVEHLE